MFRSVKKNFWAENREFGGVFVGNLVCPKCKMYILERNLIEKRPLVIEKSVLEDVYFEVTSYCCEGCGETFDVKRELRRVDKRADLKRFARYILGVLACLMLCAGCSFDRVLLICIGFFGLLLMIWTV